MKKVQFRELALFTSNSKIDFCFSFFEQSSPEEVHMRSEESFFQKTETLAFEVNMHTFFHFFTHRVKFEKT